MCNAVFRTPFSRCPLDGTKLAELDGDPLVGTILDKRYVVEECIGEGGMGRVYRAKHTRMSRHYAIKILFGDHAGDTRMRSRFAREAEAVSRLSHSNVISVVDFGETEEGLLYLVMDLADGESLADLVHRDAPLEPQRCVEILARLAKGLAHAHNHGLVHRDFKCENVIMVNEEGIEMPKIVDFGICMIIEDAPSATMLTSSGMIMGTPAVMAPEQAAGEQVDHRTDLFSLGIVGYQMVSGCLPFEGSPLEMARKNLYDEIPTIAARSGINVDPGLEAVIQKLTAKSPDDRFQDAAEAIEALKSLGIAGEFDSWTSVTPVPTTVPLRANQSAGFDATEAVSPVQYDSRQQSEIVAMAPRRSKAWLGVVAVLGVAILGGVYVLTEKNDSEAKIAADAELAAAALEDAPSAGGSEDGLEPAVQYDPSRNATNAASASETLDAGTAAAVEDASSAEPAEDPPKTVVQETVAPKPRNETKKERKRRLAAARKAKAAKEAKARSNRKLPASEQKALFDKTLKLHSKVAAMLDALEQKRGKSAVASLRREFKTMTRSSLFRNPSLQPKYYKRLQRLQVQIVLRRKKR